MRESGIMTFTFLIPFYSNRCNTQLLRENSWLEYCPDFVEAGSFLIIFGKDRGMFEDIKGD